MRTSVNPEILKSTLVKVSRILANKYNIEIIFEGNGAKTDGRVITLPSLNVITQELYTDIVAFLHHETSHIKFTDFSECKKIKAQYQFEILNGIEDVRIERLMNLAYPGTIKSLGDLNEKLLKKLDENWDKISWPKRIVFSLMAIMEGKTPRQDSEIQPHLDCLADEIAQMNLCQSTEDVRILSEKIYDKIKQSREEEKQDPNRDEKTEEEKSEDDHLIEEQTKRSEQRKQKRAFESQSIDAHSMIEEELEDAIRSEENKISKEKQNKPITMNNDYQRSTLRSNPLSTRFDKVIDVTGQGVASEFGTTRRKIQPYIGPIKIHLERVLKVDAISHWSTERERGRIDSRQLFRTKLNPNFRNVFKEKIKGETDQIAAMIAIDLSGSMNGSKIETAQESALAMGEALTSLGIPFEIVGFNTESSNEADSLVKSLSVENLVRFTRKLTVLRHYVFKSFNSSNLIGTTHIKASGCNDDGEAIAWASSRLMLRREKRKILIVLSDGSPSNPEVDCSVSANELIQQLKIASENQIETIGIGIETDDVKKFYANYAVVKNVSELPQICMSKLSEILLKNKKGLCRPVQELSVA